MGLVDEVLRFLDQRKRAAKRNIGDIANNPGAYLGMLNDQAKNFNQNVQPVVQGGMLSNRPMTQEEIQQKHSNMAMDMMPGGIGSMASIGTRMHRMGLISDDEFRALVGKGSPFRSEAEMKAIEKEMFMRKMSEQQSGRMMSPNPR